MLYKLFKRRLTSRNTILITKLFESSISSIDTRKPFFINDEYIISEFQSKLNNPSEKETCDLIIRGAVRNDLQYLGQINTETQYYKNLLLMFAECQRAIETLDKKNNTKRIIEEKLKKSGMIMKAEESSMNKENSEDRTIKPEAMQDSFTQDTSIGTFITIAPIPTRPTSTLRYLRDAQEENEGNGGSYKSDTFRASKTVSASTSSTAHRFLRQQLFSGENTTNVSHTDSSSIPYQTDTLTHKPTPGLTETTMSSDLTLGENAAVSSFEKNSNSDIRTATTDSRIDTHIATTDTATVHPVTIANIAARTEVVNRFLIRLKNMQKERKGKITSTTTDSESTTGASTLTTTPIKTIIPSLSSSLSSSSVSSSSSSVTTAKVEPIVPKVQNASDKHFDIFNVSGIAEDVDLKKNKIEKSLAFDSLIHNLKAKIFRVKKPNTKKPNTTVSKTTLDTKLLTDNLKEKKTKKKFFAEVDGAPATSPTIDYFIDHLEETKQKKREKGHTAALSATSGTFTDAIENTNVESSASRAIDLLEETKQKKREKGHKAAMSATSGTFTDAIENTNVESSASRAIDHLEERKSKIGHVKEPNTTVSKTTMDTTLLTDNLKEKKTKKKFFVKVDERNDGAPATSPTINYFIDHLEERKQKKREKGHTAALSATSGTFPEAIDNMNSESSASRAIDHLEEKKQKKRKKGQNAALSATSGTFVDAIEEANMKRKTKDKVFERSSTEAITASGTVKSFADIDYIIDNLKKYKKKNNRTNKKKEYKMGKDTRANSSTAYNYLEKKEKNFTGIFIGLIDSLEKKCLKNNATLKKDIVHNREYIDHFISNLTKAKKKKKKRINPNRVPALTSSTSAPVTFKKESEKSHPQKKFIDAFIDNLKEKKEKGSATTAHISSNTAMAASQKELEQGYHKKQINDVFSFNDSLKEKIEKGSITTFTIAPKKELYIDSDTKHVVAKGATSPSSRLTTTLEAKKTDSPSVLLKVNTISPKLTTKEEMEGQ